MSVQNAIADCLDSRTGLRHVPASKRSAAGTRHPDTALTELTQLFQGCWDLLQFNARADTEQEHKKKKKIPQLGGGRGRVLLPGQELEVEKSSRMGCGP